MTPAIPNGIRSVLAGLEEEANSVRQIQHFVTERTQLYIARSEQNVKQIFDLGANLLADQMIVLAYDYSSTVVGVIRRAAEQGKKLNLIVPESRSLNGGIPVVRAAVEAGHRVLYTTDSAIGQQLARAEAAMIGVESITAAGGCWNTTGSLMVAVLAHHCNVPLYAPTELNKFDFNSLSGEMREVKWFDLPAISGNDPILHHEAVTVMCQDLDYVPPQFITAFVTENGALATQDAVVAARASGAQPWL
jgi:ribose 1,5-bisphosphate isomerase